MEAEIENSNYDIPTICRDCFKLIEYKIKNCVYCASPRTISNPEIRSLNIAHIDCDAFYASIEKRENPTISKFPVIVGGGKKGIVTTCCYIARIKGVRSAMPMFKAKKLCPEAVVIKPRMELYKRVSREVKEKLTRLSPLVEFVSIDEAYLDLSGTTLLHKNVPAAMLAKVADEIEKTIGITVSIGLSHNKFLAKIASDLDKPRGFSIIGKIEAENILLTQKVDILRGVGEKTLSKLKGDGITFIRDLHKYRKVELLERYGSLGKKLWYFSQGLDYSKVNPKISPKSISKEITFEHICRTKRDLKRHLWLLCESVSKNLKKRNLKARTLVLKVRYQRKKIISRSLSLNFLTNFAEDFYQTSISLLEAKSSEIKGLRLLGISVKNLSPENESRKSENLFLTKNETDRLTEDAMDKIKTRFGRHSIFKGRSIKERDSKEIKT